MVFAACCKHNPLFLTSINISGIYITARFVISFVAIYERFIKPNSWSEIIIIIIKVLKKRILHIKCLDAFYNSKKRALMKQVRFHSPFKTINTVALSNGKR